MSPIESMTRAQLVKQLYLATRKANQMREMGKPDEQIEEVLAWEHQLQVALGRIPPP